MGCFPLCDFTSVDDDCLHPISSGLAKKHHSSSINPLSFFHCDTSIKRKRLPPPLLGCLPRCGLYKERQEEHLIFFFLPLFDFCFPNCDIVRLPKSSQLTNEFPFFGCFHRCELMYLNSYLTCFDALTSLSGHLMSWIVPPDLILSPFAEALVFDILFPSSSCVFLPLTWKGSFLQGALLSLMRNGVCLLQFVSPGCAHCFSAFLVGRARKYSWPLNNAGVGGTQAPYSWKPT